MPKLGKAKAHFSCPAPSWEILFSSSQMSCLDVVVLPPKCLVGSERRCAAKAKGDRERYPPKVRELGGEW